MSGEALSDPGNVHWDVSHTARGIVQWDPERSEAIKRQFGKYPNEMSVADQTKAAIWEMKINPKYSDTWKALQGGGSVESKIGTLVSNDERQRDTAGAISSRIGFAKGLPASMGGGAIVGKGDGIGVKDNGDVVDHLKDMRDKGLVTNEQCVSLATASVGFKLGSGVAGANVHDWRRGESAMGGNLVPGTPVSTFLDRQGCTNNLYAGGGSGTMGAGLDHAAVFQNYIRDSKGNIIGMNVEEQYSGSRGMHSRAYYPGGFGERNAANYSAVDVAGGGHLGGAANPLSVRDAAKDATTKTASKPAPHIGDMSLYQQNTGIKMKINNPAGMDIVAQSAMLGSGQGNFG